MCKLLQLSRVLQINDVINRQPVSVFFVLWKFWTKKCQCTEKICIDKWIQMAIWKIELTVGVYVCLCCRCVERCSGTRPRSPNTNWRTATNGNTCAVCAARRSNGRITCKSRHVQTVSHGVCLHWVGIDTAWNPFWPTGTWFLSLYRASS